MSIALQSFGLGSLFVDDETAESSHARGKRHKRERWSAARPESAKRLAARIEANSRLWERLSDGKVHRLTRKHWPGSAAGLRSMLTQRAVYRGGRVQVAVDGAGWLVRVRKERGAS